MFSGDNLKRQCSLFEDLYAICSLLAAEGEGCISTVLISNMLIFDGGADGWGLSTAQEFSLCGRTSLQAAELIAEVKGMEKANWLLRMLCGFVCTHPSLCLLCKASSAVENRSTLK